MDVTGILIAKAIPADSGADKPIYNSNNYHHDYVNDIIVTFTFSTSIKWSTCTRTH